MGGARPGQPHERPRPGDVRARRRARGRGPTSSSSRSGGCSEACCTHPRTGPGRSSSPAVLGEQAGAIGAATIAADGLRREVRNELRASSISRQAASRPSQSPVSRHLAGLERLVDLEEVLDLLDQLRRAGRRGRCTLSQRGSSGGTQMSLASSPASSCMYSTPTGRASTHDARDTSGPRGARARRAGRRRRRACRG